MKLATLPVFSPQPSTRFLREFGAALLCVVMLTSGCQRETDAQSEPARSAAVPAGAVWVGGLDGGVFVLVRKSPSTPGGTYTAEIRSAAGDVIYRGQMKADPPTAKFDPAKKESYAGWDGTSLYLSGNGSCASSKNKSRRTRTLCSVICVALDVGTLRPANPRDEMSKFNLSAIRWERHVRHHAR